MARILLVDDEASILSVLNTLLTVEGYQVVPIQDGNKAVEAIRNEEFDLMISDIRMSPINGIDLLKAARGIRLTVQVSLDGEEAARRIDPGAGRIQMGA